MSESRSDYWFGTHRVPIPYRTVPACAQATERACGSEGAHIVAIVNWVGSMKRCSRLRWGTRGPRTAPQDICVDACRTKGLMAKCHDVQLQARHHAVDLAMGCVELCHCVILGKHNILQFVRMVEAQYNLIQPDSKRQTS